MYNISNGITICLGTTAQSGKENKITCLCLSVCQSALSRS